jgi:hypothetical protein
MCLSIIRSEINGSDFKKAWEHGYTRGIGYFLGRNMLCRCSNCGLGSHGAHDAAAAGWPGLHYMAM